MTARVVGVHPRGGKEAALLSQRLTALELAAIDEAELAEIVAEEGLHLLGGKRAVLWIYRPALERLFAPQRRRDIQSISVYQHAAEDPFGRPAVWSGALDPLRLELVQASFGLAAQEGAVEVLAIPLLAARAPVGLLLVDRPMRDGPEALEPFARQVTTVLLNHEALLRTRRHELQLAALYQTAGELSAKLDLQTVLDSIIERACALVDAPISYITLVDQPVGEIYMRAAVGVTNPGFHQIRLKIGTGLGGVAAKEKRPVYTSDYLNDARFVHNDSVDEEVRKARIKSILGVPMTASTDFVGVLYAADRVVRVFTDADVDILVSLARHAALAIENAALYERATAALEEARAAGRVVEEQNRLLRRADEAHRALSELVLAGHGLDGAVHLMGQLIGEHVLVLDEHHRLLATTGEPADPFGRKLVAHGLGAALLADKDVRRTLTALAEPASVVLEPRRPARARARLVVPIVARAEVLGSVWVEGEAERLEGERSLIETATRVVALELLKERSVTEVERRLGRELLDELLVGRPGTNGPLARRGRELGLDLELPHRLVVATVKTSAGDREEATARRVRDELVAHLRRQDWCAFVAEHRGRIVALASPGEAELAARIERVARSVSTRSTEVRTVLSPECLVLDDYSLHFAACDRVLEALAQQLVRPVVDLDEARVLALLFRDGGGADARALVDSRLGKLLTYDERHGSNLTATLEAYLESGASPTRTAAALHVHVNTVYYRLARLKDMFGERFAEPRQALELQVALLARRLLSLEDSSSETGQGLDPASVDRTAPRT